jgi:GT2 family glycosyltransferase
MTSKLRALPYVLFLLPFDFMVALCLGAFVPLCFRTRRHQDTTAQRVESRKTTIIIVNWDGKHLLAECLPAVIEAVKHDGMEHDILVVDNGSTDGSVDFIRQNFSCVRILELDQNYGFIGGNNRGVAAVQTDTFVLLNNDMIVDREFLTPLLDGFRDPSVFAVTSQVFFADSTRRREETGKTRARFENGFFYLWHDDIPRSDASKESIAVFWAGGGSCAIDRRKYLALSGFDSLYRPFYLEDTDISYQAWKRGWKCLLAPSSEVIHKHRSTTQAKFGSDFVENTIRKNHYLFIWKNLTDLSMLLSHVMSLPRSQGRSMLNHTPGFEVRAFFRALQQLPEALGKRFANAAYSFVSDREVLARIGGANNS